MIICTKCKKEMSCKETGTVCVWNESHCYSGDTFECESCGASVIVTSKNSHFNPKALENPKAVKMD